MTGICVSIKLMEILCNTVPINIVVSFNNRHEVKVWVILKRLKYVTRFHSLHFEVPSLMMRSINSPADLTYMGVTRVLPFHIFIISTILSHQLKTLLNRVVSSFKIILPIIFNSCYPFLYSNILIFCKFVFHKVNFLIFNTIKFFFITFCLLYCCINKGRLTQRFTETHKVHRQKNFWT